MTLTVEEIGAEQFTKAQNDRARFRGSPVLARGYAAERGTLAAVQMGLLKLSRDIAGEYTEADRLRFSQDAAMYARMAFRGWRAYRLMKGE